MSKLEKKTLNRILACRADNPTRPVFLGYESLAKEFQCAAYSVHRAVKRLMNKGLISIIHHSYNGNQYRVHPLFDELKFRGWLGYFLSSLRKSVVFIGLSISMLLSPSEKFHTATVDAILESSLFNNRSVTVRDFSKPSNAGAREDGRTDFSKNKKRERMYQESLKYIESDVTSVQLTAWGKKNIACFPVSAIEFAQNKMKTVTGKMRDPYAMFKSFCIDYCKAKNIRVDFSPVDSIKQKYPEVMQLTFCVPSLQPIKSTKKDEEAQPVYQHPTSEWNPRHVYKPTVTQKSLDTERDGIKKHAEELKAQGIKPNIFMQIMTKEVEFSNPQKVTNNSWQDSFKKPSVTVPLPKTMIEEEVYIPLDDERLEIVNRVLESHDLLGNSLSAQTVMAGIGALMGQGATHPLYSDQTFWNGLKYVLEVIDSQAERVVGEQSLDSSPRAV
jgi:hypothetical protein